MARTFWVAIGAAGGIYAYRRSQRALDEAKQRGFNENLQVAAGLAAVAGSKAMRIAGAAESALRAGRDIRGSESAPGTINELAGSQNPAKASDKRPPEQAPYKTSVQKTRRTNDQPENPWKATSNGLS